MYPQGELNGLAGRKAGVRRVIARRRARCADAAVVATKPLQWIDTAWRVWRGIAPFARLAASPLGGAAARAIFPGQRILRTVLRWAPPVLSVIGVLRKLRRS